jgi:hypothetical protein
MCKEDNDCDFPRRNSSSRGNEPVDIEKSSSSMDSMEGRQAQRGDATVIEPTASSKGRQSNAVTNTTGGNSDCSSTGSSITDAASSSSSSSACKSSSNSGDNVESTSSDASKKSGSKKDRSKFRKGKWTVSTLNPSHYAIEQRLIKCLCRSKRRSILLRLYTTLVRAS